MNEFMVLLFVLLLIFAVFTLKASPVILDDEALTINEHTADLIDEE